MKTSISTLIEEQEEYRKIPLNKNGYQVIECIEDDGNLVKITVLKPEHVYCNFVVLLIALWV
jgi:hypothetical protein